MLNGWKRRVENLKAELLVLYIATQDPRVSRWHKLLFAVVIGYLFSPLDLIPDFIPILGYLDDLLIVPAGIWIMFKIIPPAVLADARERVREGDAEEVPVGWKTAIAVAILWIIVLVGIIWFLMGLSKRLDLL